MLGHQSRTDIVSMEPPITHHPPAMLPPNQMSTDRRGYYMPSLTDNNYFWRNCSPESFSFRNKPILIGRQSLYTILLLLLLLGTGRVGDGIKYKCNKYNR
uniref:Uncharacterized protein n=1 Tax=Lutzomyia longipalpis TaxID=7200 RepID=A0A1B0GIV5_LUTLO